MTSPFNILYLLFLPVALCSCERTEKAVSSIIVEGEYQKPIEDFNSQEPVRTYLEIRNLLSEAEIERASNLTTDPSKFLDKMTQYRDLIGENKFYESHKKIRGALLLHSAYHDGNQSLLVLDTGKVKAAVFFLRDGKSFLEIALGGEVEVSPLLNRKFYIAKGEPDAILSE